MQAGLVSRRLTFRDIFTAVAVILLRVLILIDRQSRDSAADQRLLEEQQQLVTEALREQRPVLLSTSIPPHPPLASPLVPPRAADPLQALATFSTDA